MQPENVRTDDATAVKMGGSYVMLSPWWVLVCQPESFLGISSFSSIPGQCEMRNRLARGSGPLQRATMAVTLLLQLAVRCALALAEF